jgi:DNA-directed RNA polymerase specialized sigma24 family protein
MTTMIHDRRQEILALEPRLLGCAEALTHDAGEAQALVRQTFKLAKDRNYGLAEGGNPEVWIFRLLRQRFHSVERDRDSRRDRRGPLAGFGSVRGVPGPNAEGESK